MVDKYWLSAGNHNNPEAGRCAMEWVSYIAGERHTDQPVCVSPVLRRYCIRLNDRLNDTDRQKLRLYLARTIGTAGDGLDAMRVQLCREWVIKVALPDYLDMAGRHEIAERFRSMPDALVAENTMRLLQEARDVAYEARRESLNRLRDKVYVKVGKHAAAAAAAVAAADAVAVAVADAVAVAVAVAVADAVAVAVADAVAVAVAVADAVAVAVADAVADADGDTYENVYSAIYAKALEVLKPTAERHNAMAFELLDRMLPKVAVELPVEASCRVRELEDLLAS